MSTMNSDKHAFYMFVFISSVYLALLKKKKKLAKLNF